MIPEKRYKYINLEVVQEMAGDDDEFILQMIDTYLVSIPASVQKLAAAIKDRNATDITFHAHRLKGSMYFTNTGELNDMILKIEDNARNAHFDTIDGDLQQLQHMISEINLELEDIRTFYQ